MSKRQRWSTIGLRALAARRGRWIFGLCLALATGSGACTRVEPSTAQPSEDSPRPPSPTTSTRAKTSAAAADERVVPTRGSPSGSVFRDAATPAVDACAPVPAAMACVPAGSFVRGVDHDPHQCMQFGQPRSGASSAVPAMTIWVDTFYIDLTEVTNEAYALCVERGACNPARPLYYDFDGPLQPITGVSWYDADRYCRAVGKRLPTEAEWEKAARGPAGEINPWGDAPASCETAVIEDRKKGRSCGVKKRGGKADKGRVLDVKSRPPGRYGLYDMIGNAEEWVADWWTESWQACGAPCAGRNPKGPGRCTTDDDCPHQRYKVVRGGSWFWPAEHATGYHRRRHSPLNEPFHHFGFRCAADPPDTSAGRDAGIAARATKKP